MGSARVSGLAVTALKMVKPGPARANSSSSVKSNRQKIACQVNWIFVSGGWFELSIIMIIYHNLLSMSGPPSHTWLTVKSTVKRRASDG